MELQGVMRHVESCFGPFGHSVSLGTRQAQKSFQTHMMVFQGDEAKVDAPFGQFGYSANLDTWFVPNVPQVHKSFWTHSMVLLGDKAQVDAHFYLFGASAIVDARQVHCLRRTYYWLGNHFESTRWNSQVMWVMWNLVSVRLETTLVLEQDRYTV